MAKKDKITDNDVAAKISNPGAMPEFQDFEEEQITLPPYWNPDPPEEVMSREDYIVEVDAGRGRWWYGMPIMVDSADPEFPRYVVQAEKPVACRVGSKDEASDVTVQPGEYFTLSTYAGLPLDRYIGVRVLVQVKGQRDVGRPQLMWEFTLKVAKEDKKQLTADRKQAALDAVAKFRASRKAEAKQLPAAG